MTAKRLHILIVGTDPQTGKGGIASVLPAYFSALEDAGLSWDFLCTHKTGVWGGKWRFWLLALGKLPWLIMGARRKGLEPIVYAHPGAGLSLFRAGTLLGFARVMRSKTLLQLHTPAVLSYLDVRWQRWGLERVLDTAERIAVLTPWWQQKLEGWRNYQFDIIPNPLSALLEEQARQKVATRSPARRSLQVLSMARLVEEKGVARVLEAMADLPETYQLVIAGDGPEYEKLLALCQRLSLEKRVRFVGWVNGAQKAKLLEEADIFCLPSRYDSFGMAFVEAMAYGKPVVALDWGPVKDVVPHTQAGFLLQEDSPQAVAAALRKLEDDEHRQMMGQYGKSWVLEQFSLHSVGTKLRLVFERL